MSKLRGVRPERKDLNIDIGRNVWLSTEMLRRWPYYVDFRTIFLGVTEKILKMGIVEYSSEMFMTLEPISHRRLNCLCCEWIFIFAAVLK